MPHSFPTRRSSDLIRVRRVCAEGGRRRWRHRGMTGDVSTGCEPSPYATSSDSRTTCASPSSIWVSRCSRHHVAGRAGSPGGISAVSLALRGASERGKASGGDRGCRYVYIAVVCVYTKKKNTRKQ